MKKIAKKLAKIAGLYISMGVFIAVMMSVAGMYNSLVIQQTMGPMGLSGYMIIMAYAAILWFHIGITCIVSPMDYFRYSYSKIGVVLVIAVFLAGVVAIIRKKD